VVGATGASYCFTRLSKIGLSVGKLVFPTALVAVVLKVRQAAQDVLFQLDAHLRLYLDAFHNRAAPIAAEIASLSVFSFSKTSNNFCSGSGSCVLTGGSL
jgi:hypothetical protein